MGTKRDKVKSHGMLNQAKSVKGKIILLVATACLLTAWVFLAVIQINTVYLPRRSENAVGSKFVAHRGFSSVYFENTAQAFAAAGKESRFQGIETDVWRTKDGVWVCSHDNNPFMDKDIYITDNNYDDIKDLILDTTNALPSINTTEVYQIPTMVEYLLTCIRYQKIPFLEVKHKLDEESAKELVTISSRYVRTIEYLMFSKKNAEVLLRLFPKLSITLFTSSNIKAFFYTQMGYNIGVNQKGLSEKAIQRAHNKNRFVSVYTVNEPEDMQRWVAGNADYIITDVLPLM